MPIPGYRDGPNHYWVMGKDGSPFVMPRDWFAAAPHLRGSPGLRPYTDAELQLRIQTLRKYEKGWHDVTVRPGGRCTMEHGNHDRRHNDLLRVVGDKREDDDTSDGWMPEWNKPLTKGDLLMIVTFAIIGIALVRIIAAFM